MREPRRIGRVLSGARSGALAALCLAAACLAACAPIPRARTLPPTIYSVYVPMFQNLTAEPGLEELATRATQREFLADGRLRVERRARADAWVECTIRGFATDPASFGTDDFPTFTRAEIEVDVVVRENLPQKPLLGKHRRVRVSQNYPSDLRRSISVTEEEAIEDLMDQLAREIVREVLTGEYDADATGETDAKKADDGSDVFREIPE